MSVIHDESVSFIHERVGNPAADASSFTRLPLSDVTRNYYALTTHYKGREGRQKEERESSAGPEGGGRGERISNRVPGHTHTHTSRGILGLE